METRKPTKIEIVRGSRTILGTDFPITDMIEKSGVGSKPWVVTLGICNGTPISGKSFRTLTAAKDYLGEE